MILTLCLLVGNEGAAQEAKQDSYEPRYGMHGTDFLVEPRYNHLTRQLIRNTKKFDYGDYRSQYAMSRRYDPMGDEAREKLLNAAYIVQNEQDQETLGAALKEYKSHIMDHLANMSVVLLAMSLSQDDERFGSPEFFMRIRNGLLQSVKYSGDGSSLSNAYSVVTLAEETMLLNSLHVKVLDTTSSHSGILYYNIHEVEDLETGLNHAVFVDITRPMSYLEQKQREKPPVFSLRPGK